MVKNFASVLTLLMPLWAFSQDSGKSLLMQFAHSGDSAATDSLSRILIQNCRDEKDSICLADAYEVTGSAFFTLNHEELTFDYYELSIDLYDDLGEHHHAARIAKQLAIIYRNTLRLENASETGQRSLDFYYATDNKVEIINVLNILATINLARGNIEEAVNQSHSSIGISREIGSKMTEAEAQLNLTQAFIDIGSFDSAQIAASEAIEIFENEKINHGQINAYRLMGEALLGLGEFDQALSFVDRSIEMSTKAGSMKPTVRGGTIKARILLSQKEISMAILELKTSLEKAIAFNFTEQVLECHHLLFKVYESIGNNDQAFGHLRAYNFIRDSTYNLELAKEIERQNAKFSLTNKQREVAFFRQQSELKDLRLKQARNRNITIAVSLTLILFISFLVYQRRMLHQKLKFSEEKATLQQENLSAVITGELQERERISKDLHDGLGQLLSTVRLSLTSNEDEEAHPGLKIVDKAIDEMRAISHAMMPPALSRHGLVPALREMTRTVNESGVLEVALYEPDININESLSRLQIVTIYRVVQEIVNNALKHAEATKLTIIMDASEYLKIKISDNGKGFDLLETKSSKAFGLRNIESRMELIKGNVSISSASGSGTEIQLTIPYHTI